MVSSAYIHIPFCDNICTYCDFCKVLTNRKWINEYLKELTKEIKQNYKNETIKTLYIGGGTPSALTVEELQKLFNIIKTFKLDKNYEFTIECNPENLTKEKLILFKENKVNRLSIGIQSFNDKYLKYLGRKHNKEQTTDIINKAKELGFNNISIDLIYALTNQALKELKKDIEEFLKLEVNHISTYSLILEENTCLTINKTVSMDEELDYKMYKLIIDKLKENNFNHYEISNFSKKGYESKHNLNYWNNNEYYGFGLGSHGYINNIRYENTRSISNYLKGYYKLKETHISKEEQIENEIILGLRKIEGINKNFFQKKYKINIKKISNINKLIKENKLRENEKNISINKDYLYVMNEILIDIIN